MHAPTPRPAGTELATPRRRRPRLERFLLVWRRLMRRPVAVVSLVICAVAFVMFAFGPWITPHDPFLPSIMERLQGPSLAHPFGKDEVGRDILSRVIYGAHLTLALGLMSIAIAVVIGVSLGLVSGSFGGPVDALIMRASDLLLSLPYFLLALTLVAAMGPGYRNSVIAIGVWMIPHFTRLVRGQVLALREMEFVQAAQALGESRLDIMLRYLLPNCASPIIVQTTLYFPRAIMLGAALGFLGLSTQPPMPEWGVLLATSREYMVTAPHVLIFPAVTLLIVALAFNLLGDAMRDILDPRLQDMVK
jgi:ABC-type dipeptide/oligopeptide/nickel transport system permease subunit